MTDSPTLTDEPVPDLADVDAVDGTGTELVEPTTIEPPAELPAPAPIADTPTITVGRVVDFAYSLLERVDTLPALSARLDEIQAATRAVYAEYSRGISEVNRRFGESLQPLDIERAALELQVAAGEAAKEQLSKLAGLIPTTQTT